MNINKLKHVEDSPQYVMLGRDPLINNPPQDLWKQEVWDIYKGDKLVYHKDKTIENCWKRYGIVSRDDTQEKFNDSLFLGYTPLASYAYSTGDYKLYLNDTLGMNKPSVTNTEIPIPTDLTVVHSGMTAGEYFAENSLNVHLFACNSPELLDMVYNHIKDNDLTGRFFNCLFGSNYGSIRTELRGKTEWIFNINLEPPDPFYVSYGMQLIGLFQNVDTTANLKFHFKKGHVVSMDNMFSINHHTTPWITVTYDPQWTKEDRLKGIVGFTPISVQKLFNGCYGAWKQVEFFKYVNTQYCRDFLYTFDGPMRNYNKVHCFFECEPYEEHPANTITPNQYSYSNSVNSWEVFRYKNPDAPNEKDRRLSVQYGSIEMFLGWGQRTDIDIERIIDLKWVVKSMFYHGFCTGMQIKKCKFRNVGFSFGLSDTLGNITELDEEHVKYLLNNVKDLSTYEVGKEHLSGVVQNSATMEINDRWKTIMDSMPNIYQTLKNKGWIVKLNNTIINN